MTGSDAFFGALLFVWKACASEFKFDLGNAFEKLSS